MSANKKQSAFTIVELLIVIVVIGILAALVLNSFSGAQVKARNAQTVSLAKAYHTAIMAYAADKGSYPPDWACLGSGYPDKDNDGAGGDCDGDATTTWLEENTAFNTAIQPYVGGGENKVNPRILQSGWGQWGVGALYTYNAPTTLDGQALNRWIVYHLEGTGSKCTAGPIATMTGWPTFVSGATNGTSGDNWADGVRCWVPLPQTP